MPVMGDAPLAVVPWIGEPGAPGTNQQHGSPVSAQQRPAPRSTEQPPAARRPSQACAPSPGWSTSQATTQEWTSDEDYGRFRATRCMTPTTAATQSNDTTRTGRKVGKKLSSCDANVTLRTAATAMPATIPLRVIGLLMRSLPSPLLYALRVAIRVELQSGLSSGTCHTRSDTRRPPQQAL